MISRRAGSALGACLAFCAALGVCEALHAQSAADAELARGVSALRAGHNQDAVDALEAAYRLDPKPPILLDLGIAYTNLGQVHDALDALDAYVRYADKARDAQNIALVSAEITRLRAQSALIRLQPSPADAQLAIDGHALRARSGEIVVLAGSHRVDVTASGYAPYAQVVQLPPGKLTLEVALQKLGSRPSTLPPSAAAPAPSEPVQPKTRPTAAAEPPPSSPSTCLLGELCLGPTLDLGLPNVIGGGLQLRFGKYFGAGFDVQVLPSITLRAATARASLFTIDGRIYPFGGSFFLAGGFAFQAINGSVDNGQIAAQAHVGLPSFFAGIGFMGHDGLVLGVDLGVLVPLSGKTVSTTFTTDPAALQGVPPATVDRVKRDAEHGVKKILDLLPVFAQLNLVRIGYLF